MFAYLLISLDATREDDIYDKLKKMAEIKDLHILFGEWDLIAKVQLENSEALGTFVISKVRNIPGVKLTSTLIVAR